MKKILVFAVILALLVPAAAFAATEFSLGGFIKLDTFWDSTQESKNMNLGIARNNAGYFMHGRTKFTAQGSRFNFTIKGPKLFGAQTTGFIEMDFDENEQGATTAAGIPAVTGTAASSSNNYIPRLRHAMFRFNWPETELLLGQYWSMFCEWYPELVEDGPFQGTGTPTARIPQIRLSQKFLGWGTASFLLGNPNGISQGQSYSQFDSSGQSAIVPQLQGKLQYQQNVYGQAPYYGKPTPLTVQLVGGWQRSFLAETGQFNAFALRTWGNNAYSAAIPVPMTNHQNMDPWLVMASAFVPVIPTQSANLAGTASILAQWWVGAGVDAFGFTGSQNYFRFNTNRGGVNQYEVVLQKRFGGQVQGQYYFNNQWFITAAYGMSTCIDGDLDGRDPGARLGGAAVGVNPGNGSNPQGYKYAFTGDILRTWQQAEVALWYRPIQAIKFGLQYAYGQNAYFQSVMGGNAITGQNVPAATAPANTNAFNAFTQAGGTPWNTTNYGVAHRIEFVGFFYF